jgi:signal transduction histidine kinase
MKGARTSLRVTGTVLMFAAFTLGALAAWLWMESKARWTQHLDQAFFAGALLHDALRDGTGIPAGFAMTPLNQDAQALADNGDFERLPDIPRPALVTNVSILGNPNDRLSLGALTIAIVSADLRYPLASLPSRDSDAPWEVLGLLSRTLATYCSEPVVFAHLTDRPWVRIEGPGVWDCAAAPADLRLPAALLAAAALGILSTLVLNTSARFTEFADTLRSRRRLGGPDTYEIDGPEELSEIVDAVNAHLEIEREQLAKRAIVLSGVSHDLGTPATRLRLRAALIPDPELRKKLETDIDSMTGIIESVLTYTRAELNAEEPRRISLTSLLDSIVADYQDTGRPVALREADNIVVRGAQSLFMSRRGQGTVPDERRVVVTARPFTLQRAISNLIDNALKYGRRATVSLETDAEQAVITIEDEGTETSIEEIERLMAPFQRGANIQSIDGHGLGLTIAATVATLHGGELTFEPGARGLRARMAILRR